MTKTPGRIRPAAREDVAQIVAMVRELADYERAPEQAVATDEQFEAALFGPRASVYCLVVDGDTDNLAGFALYFLNFSTWLGRHGIYLEDLFVRPDYRGRGHGRALLAALARICIERGYGRLEWWVLDWNEPALGFYRSLAAVPMDEWTVHRVTGPALDALASASDGQMQASDREGT